MKQKELIQTLPKHLRQFVVEQDYENYNAQDQAVWRYIMQQNIKHLGIYAHPVYLEGLEKTGISLDRIPSIDEMNVCLEKLGWQAVVVDGFIPPAAFMEFQALKILTIAVEMRTIDHILYTPAPDIVHESAGHAPFIVDEEYSEYLQKIGKIGSKALYTKLDNDIYEAIRHLSIIKEFPNTPKDKIEEAENDLNDKMKRNVTPSEATLLSRFHWWTVEYGLVGSIDNFKIYGAGILSSVGESKHCVKPEVKKIALSLKAIETSYDITTMQPQLFVTKGCREMIDLIEQYAENMAFKKGGLDSIKLAIECGIVCTAEYSSGIQVSGLIKTVLDFNDMESFIATAGPSQLSYLDKQLDGHGANYHQHGFSSPIGKLINTNKALEDFNESDLLAAQIELNKIVTLNFESGICVKGELISLLTKNKKNILMSFSQCTVIDKNNSILFKPEWGIYDMAVGEKITSIFAGGADKEKFETYPEKSTKTAIPIIHTESEKKLYNMYQSVREMRASKIDLDKLILFTEQIITQYQNEWLLLMEIYEILIKYSLAPDTQDKILIKLNEIKIKSNDFSILIEDGLALVQEKNLVQAL